MVNIWSRSRSPLRYPGSKARFAAFIAQALRFAGHTGCLFVEPFCGGASVSIALLEAGLVSRIALNDKDPGIAAFWNTVFDPADARWLANQVMNVPITLDEWDRQKRMSPTTTRKAALRCLFLNRTSFNGILHARGGPIGGRTQKNRTLDARFNREALAARIVELSQLGERVTVTCEDWMTSCGRHLDDPHAVYFLDPPFYRKAESLYVHCFDEDDHRVLRNHLLCMSRPWVLSYDDTPEVRELLDGWQILRVQAETVYSAHPRGGHSAAGRELLYSNLRSIRMLAKSWPAKQGLAISDKRTRGSRVLFKRRCMTQLSLFATEHPQLHLFEEATV